LQALVNRQHERFQQSCVGRTFDVLFDKLGKFDGQITGRSPYLQPVQVTGEPSLIGSIAPVTITGTRTDAKSLFGVIAHPAGQLHNAASFAEAGA
jgi:tRNA-2-methylthio-N6-dimethylallyladenosine synthase